MISTYDRIGSDYKHTRKAEPRLARLIASELRETQTVVNVGAGTGSYEPSDRFVVAVEPSRMMLHQRSATTAPAVQAIAERLPFGDDAFDAAMAVLTIHHWSDPEAGVLEMSRVARDRIVLLTWDPSSDGFWLMSDYFPEFLEADRRQFPSVERLASVLQDARVIPVPVSHDCADGFLGAYWRRPEAYLDPEIRNGISSFATRGDLSPLRRLEEDLRSGEWQRRYEALLAAEELDAGYRLVVGRPTTTATSHRNNLRRSLASRERASFGEESLCGVEGPRVN